MPCWQNRRGTNRRRLSESAEQASHTDFRPNFRQKQRLVDQYHHAALLLEAERDQTFLAVTSAGDSGHDDQ